MELLQRDIRYALRNMRKSPGFTVLVVLTLAVGIGASTGIFSVLENILMEPFPYPDAQRFMYIQIHDTEQDEPGGRFFFNGPEVLAFVEQNHVFDRAIAHDRLDVLYRSSEGTQLLTGLYVTPGTFEFFGMAPLLGRVMQPADYEPAAPPVFVLRYKTWVNEFGAEPTILNKNFVLNGIPRTLIGIMPPRFGWGDADLWIPEKLSPTVEQTALAGASPERWFFLGHLKPGVSVRQAEADVTVIASRLAEVDPDRYPDHWTVEITPLVDVVVGHFRTTLYIVLAAVGLLLLIGCGNVANLLLAKATTREKEFAIRSAVGASRRNVIIQLLMESLIFAVGGAAVGTLLAGVSLRFLIALVPQDTIPAETVIRLNMPVLLFTLGVTILTVFIFGLVPALKAARKDLNAPLRDAGRGLGGAPHGGLRSALVILEVALSLALLVSAGLLMRSFVALREVHLGFRPDHVVFARLPLPPERYKTADQLTGFYRPLLLRLKTLPGVVAAAETSTLPPYEGGRGEIEIVGKAHVEGWKSLTQMCSQDYFQVLNLQLIAGRYFTEAEVNAARKLAVVNQTFVKKYLPGENPIGKHVRLARLAQLQDKVSDPTFEIIGVLADAKNRGPEDPAEPETWIPYTLTSSTLRGVLVRTANEPLSMLKPIRHEIWATDPNVALADIGTLDGYIAQFSYAGPKFSSTLMIIFGAFGLILVTVGVYSVLSYTSVRRTQEIGIRMALGAQASDVIRMIVGMGLRLLAVGVVIGLVATLALGKIIATQLWGVSAYDPWTFAGASVVLVITGLLACWLPARRAARVDPMIALRYE